MNIALEPFVPQEVCLACRGCCRFSGPQTSWVPFFTAEEIGGLVAEKLVPADFFPGGAGAGRGARIRCVKGKEGAAYFCPCLDPAKNTCRVYHNRPLDCRLYPFLLVLRGPGVWLCADGLCPYVAETRGTEPFKKYTAGLVFLLTGSEFVRLAERNPGIIQPYDGEIEMLAPLAALNHVHVMGSALPER